MFALAAVLVSSACASSNRAGELEPFTQVGPPSSIRVIVQNLNFSEARLYAIRRGMRTSLGIVGGKQDAEFTIDWSIPDPLQIEIHLLAGPTCTTRELQADPGDIIELQIASVFSDSQACR